MPPSARLLKVPALGLAAVLPFRAILTVKT
jgi:hypothetical protein